MNSCEFSYFSTDYYSCLLGQNVNQGINSFLAGLNAGSINTNPITDEIRKIGTVLTETILKEAGTSAKGLQEIAVSAVKDFSSGPLSDEIKKTGALLTETLLKEAEITAKGLQEIAVNTVKDTAIELLPWIVLTGVVLVGTPLLVNYLFKKTTTTTEETKLGKEVCNASLLDRAYYGTSNFISGLWNSAHHYFASEPSAIFNPKLTQQIDGIAQETYRLYQRGGQFKHLCLYGLEGTGKSMISKEIARQAHMNYIKISGSDLARMLQASDCISELRKFFEKAKGTVICIEKAELLSKFLKNNNQFELLEDFLELIDEQSKKIMFVLESNKFEVDNQIIDKFEHQIYVPVPGLEEKKKIIQQNLPHLFNHQEITEIFTENKIHEIALKLDSIDATGKMVVNILKEIKNEKIMSIDNQLTIKIVDSVVNKKY